MLTILVAILVIVLGVVVGALHRQRVRNASIAAQLAAAESDLQHLQEACSRLAPAGVVQQIVLNGATPESSLGAERKTVTALFVDLVGYTALSEQLEPATLARVLNGYFQRMSDAIHEHRGHVSTYMGDGILAYFGAMHPNPWQCNDAALAALAMRAAIREYNVELKRNRLPPLAMGIGIHRGAGLAGLIGSRERMEYAFVGRTVNVAARVQALTRTYKVDILVTDVVRAALDTSFALDAMPAELLKGIAEPVVTYAVRSKSRTSECRSAQ